jgi:hypothetical protein
MRIGQTKLLVYAKTKFPMVHAIESVNSSLLYSEKDMALLTLHDNGLIRDCNNACIKLLDCEFDKLHLQHISIFSAAGSS